MVILSVFSFPEFTTAFNHIPWCFYDFLKCFSSFSSVFSLFSILGFVASSYCFRFLNEGKGCPCFLTWKQSSDSVSYFKPVVLKFFPENLYDEKECLYNLPVLFIFGVLMKVKCCFWRNLLGKIETCFLFNICVFLEHLWQNFFSDLNSFWGNPLILFSKCLLLLIGKIM